jgi:hypothetical protein
VRVESLQKWALVAEVVGALAVVTTLAFVAVETRANTNALQAQTFQSLMQELNDYRLTLLDHPERYAIVDRARDDGVQSLTRQEIQTLRLPILVQWGIYESAYFANARGVLGPIEWTRFASAMCRTAQTGENYWVVEGFAPVAETLTPEFVSFIEAECEYTIPRS